LFIDFYLSFRHSHQPHPTQEIQTAVFQPRPAYLSAPHLTESTGTPSAARWALLLPYCDFRTQVELLDGIFSICLRDQVSVVIWLYGIKPKSSRLEVLTHHNSYRVVAADITNMRAAEATWILTAGIILRHIRGTSALSGGKFGDLEKSDMLDLDVLDEDGGMIAQKVIVTVLTSASIPKTEEKLLEENLGNKKPSHQEISVVTVTSESAVLISYPKITEAPSLFKRKIGSNRWDLIHEGIQGQKRDATQCPVDYQLCPDNVGGGCCPNDRVCGKESCLPSSAAPASACGKLGYTACALAEGGTYLYDVV
jgi:hypothetical protein